MKKFHFIWILILCALSGCPRNGGDSIISNLISSDFPADMDVPIVNNSALLKGDIAFVVQDNPFAIIPVNTTTNPPSLSSIFPIVNLSSLKPSGGSIFGSDLFISNEFMGAVCYTGSDSNGTHITGVALFNPSTGALLSNVNCRLSVGTTRKTLDYSQSGNSVSYRSISNFLTSFASGVVILGNSMYVSTSNLDTSNYSTFYPGTVMVFDLSPLPGTPTLQKTIFTGQDGGDPTIGFYNPVQVSLYGNKILLSSSGAVEFNSLYQSVVKTNGAIEIIDSTTNTITTSHNLGLCGLNPEEIKIYNDGTNDIAVVGSQIFGRLYRVNLTTNTIVNKDTNPIVINGETSGETNSVAVSSDGKYFFVASQKDNKLYTIDVASANTTPSNPTKLNTVNASNTGFSAFPSNLETLPAQGSTQRFLYTKGQPADVKSLSYP